MTPPAFPLLAAHVAAAERHLDGESTLLPWLLRWLMATRRIGMRTQIAYEVPWLGRRVDLALLNARGTATAFELKIGRLQRVLEQAAYNGSSFHRSWVVTGNRPRDEGLTWARELGLGLIVVQPPNVRLVVPAMARHPDRGTLRYLRTAIAARAAGAPA